MADLVGLIVGVVGGLRAWRLRTCLVAPLVVPSIEIVVNTIRFGAAAMVFWTPILLGLTVGATAGAKTLIGFLRTRPVDLG